jgi:hypothetical protein
MARKQELAVLAASSRLQHSEHSQQTSVQTVVCKRGRGMNPCGHNANSTKAGNEVPAAYFKAKNVTVCMAACKRTCTAAEGETSESSR